MTIFSKFDLPKYPVSNPVTNNYNNNVTVNLDLNQDCDCDYTDEEYDSYGNQGKTFTPSQISKFIDMLPLPQMFKMRLKDLLDDGNEGYRKFQGQPEYRTTLHNGNFSTEPCQPNQYYTLRGVCPDNFLDLVMKGVLSSTNRPNEYQSVKDLFDFMKSNGLPMLNLKHLQDIFDQGQFMMDGNTPFQVPSDIQNAAGRFLANDNSLYLKLEMMLSLNQDQYNQSSFKDLFSGILGPGHSCNSQLDAQNAGKSVTDFMTQNNIDILSKEQVREMAEKGQVTMGDGRVIVVTPDVQKGAQKLMENGGALFDELETGAKGVKDGMLGRWDFDAAMQKGFGKNLASSPDSTGSIYKFMAENNIDTLTKKQMQEIVDTGKCTLPDGRVITVPPEVQQGARKLMDNGGALFDQLESADDNGRKDGILSRNGIVAAAKQGLIPLPTADEAVSGIQDFMKRNNIALLSKDQVKELAETGQVTVNGKVIKGEPKDQLAAMKLMENNGVLFDQLESANTGEKDGLLGQKDLPAALKQGTYNNGQETNNGLPAPARAAELIDTFLDKNNIPLLSKDQVKEMAETGHLKLPDGRVITVSWDEQKAARRLMENNGALFDKLESAFTGMKDGQIGQGDYEATKGIFPPGFWGMIRKKAGFDWGE